MIEIETGRKRKCIEKEIYQNLAFVGAPISHCFTTSCGYPDIPIMDVVEVYDFVGFAYNRMQM